MYRTTIPAFAAFSAALLPVPLAALLAAKLKQAGHLHSANVPENRIIPTRQKHLFFTLVAGLLTAAVSWGATECPVAAPAAPLAKLDAYDVVFTSPSKDEADSIPLGNGATGINLWVEENGDLLFYLAHNDAISEMHRLLKLGRVRVSLSPNPFARGKPFAQTLILRDGCCEITAGDKGSECPTPHPGGRRFPDRLRERPERSASHRYRHAGKLAHEAQGVAAGRKCIYLDLSRRYPGECGHVERGVCRCDFGKPWIRNRVSPQRTLSGANSRQIPTPGSLCRNDFRSDLAPHLRKHDLRPRLRQQQAKHSGDERTSQIF